MVPAEYEARGGGWFFPVECAFFSFVLVFVRLLKFIIVESSSIANGQYIYFKENKSTYYNNFNQEIGYS